MRDHLRCIRSELPDGWKVRLAKAYSPAHDCVMWTCWIDEPTMGWSEWHCGPDPAALMDWARAYVDECMASTVPA